MGTRADLAPLEGLTLDHPFWTVESRAERQCAGSGCGAAANRLGTKRLPDFTQTTNSVGPHNGDMYHAAVYLNNVGCVLIERGAYHEALDSVRDAVQVMKAAVTPHSTDCATLDVHSLTTKAAQRMASLSAEEPLFNEMASNARSSIAVTKVDLSDFGHLEIEDMITINLEEEMVVCPVRIDAEERLDECPSDAQRDVDSAIMLHNLGLVNAYLARQYAACPDAQAASLYHQLNEAALQMLRFADSMLSQQLENTSACLYAPDPYETTRMAKIHMAVLHGLLQIRVSRQVQRRDDSLHASAHGSDIHLDDDCDELLHRWYFLQDYSFMMEQSAIFPCPELFPAPAA
jgi:hypothetical protein